MVTMEEGGKILFFPPSLKILWCKIFISCIENIIAERAKFLTEWNITKIMNESDSDLSSDGSINSLCFSDSNNSELMEVYDIENTVDAPRVLGWNIISDLPNLNFSSDCGVKLNSSQSLEKELDYFNLYFSQDIIDCSTNQWICCVANGEICI